MTFLGKLSKIFETLVYDDEIKLMVNKIMTDKNHIKLVLSMILKKILTSTLAGLDIIHSGSSLYETHSVFIFHIWKNFLSKKCPDLFVAPILPFF